MTNDHDPGYGDFLGDEPDIDYDTPAEMPDGQAEALDRASWHLKMAAKYSRQLSEIDAVYKAEMERLDIRRQHRLRILANQIAWHETPVESLHRALLAEDPKRKSIELPYGTSKIRASKTPKLEFTDMAATLAWAEENHPDILGRTINVTGVKTIASTSPDFRMVVDDNGEIIPGVEASMPESSWSASYDSGEQ
jgi:hypothetical protein